jgi:hypothetical protein
LNTNIRKLYEINKYIFVYVYIDINIQFSSKAQKNG